MKASRSFPLYLPLILLVLSLAPVTSARETGDTAVTQGTITDDLYLAGRSVDVLASVAGDVVVAGGQVTIDNSVGGDVMAAGGTVTVRARVGDDVRLAGGSISISGAVGDDAIAAGGHVRLTPRASVGGRAWFGGHTVDVGGRIAKDLRAGGNRVVITGEIGGDVELFADSIEIQPGAVIRGDLDYYGRNEAQIASDATIAGTVTRHPVRAHEEVREGARFVGGIARLALYLGLVLTAIAFYLFFPMAAVGAAGTLIESPWKSLGLGLAILAATPLVVVLLFASVIGIWLALTAIALYLVLLLFGFLTAILNIGDWLLRLIRRSAAPTKSGRVLSIIAAFVVLWLVRLVPVLGGLVVFALLLFGPGALALHLWRRYVA